MPTGGGRTTEYAIWRACERFNILPPGCKQEFDNMTNWAVCMLIGYNQIREIEEIKLMSAMRS